MTTQELLEQKVRESGSLVERLESCRARIAAMCKEGRPPKMTIPVQWDDDDFFISVTLKDAEQCVHLTRLSRPSRKKPCKFWSNASRTCAINNAAHVKRNPLGGLAQQKGSNDKTNRCKN